MSNGDRVATAAAIAFSASLLIGFAIFGVSWEKPTPVLILLPTLILTFTGLYNIASR